MPLYEYECQSCGRRTEVLQRMDDAPILVCPDCGGPLKKLISRSGFHFKGSGWHVTDYARNSGSSKAGGAASEAASDTTKPAAAAAKEGAPAKPEATAPKGTSS